MLENVRYFSLLVQKKSNQKKAHPAFAPFAQCAKGSFDQRNWWSAIHGDHSLSHRYAMSKTFPESFFLTRPPWRGKKRRTSVCVALTGIFRCPHRYGRGLKARASIPVPAKKNKAPKIKGLEAKNLELVKLTSSSASRQRVSTASSVALLRYWITSVGSYC